MGVGMRGHVGRALLVCGALCVGVSASTAQEWAAKTVDADQHEVTGDRCFAPASLMHKPGEELVHKRDHGFDAPATAREMAPFAPVPQGLRGAIRRVALPPGRKLVALTFDLCEQPGEIAGYDGAIIDYLREQNVKATFFAGGKWMRSHAERAAQLIADPLFEVGNHSEAHRNLRLLSGRSLEEEIRGPQRTYEALAADLSARQCVRAKPMSPRMGLFRFPYGACNQPALDAVAANGLLAIQWDLSTGDPSPQQSAKAIASAMVHAKPGSILIAHANGRGHHTREALPMAIPALKAKGFEFVTVSELLAAGTPEIVGQCYDAKPGDTDRYDHPLGLKLSAKPKDK